MSLNYDKEYAMTFHSPGIEPWITGFLKSKRFENALDIGCGLGLISLILKLYLNNVGYLVGLDISCEKLLKVKHLNLYDDLIVADAEIPPFRAKVFDLVIACEVIHGLLPRVLEFTEALSKNSMVLTMPSLPNGVSVKHLIEKGYKCYRYVLRGFILIELNGYRILLASKTKFFRIVEFLLYLLKPIIKAVGFLERGYLLVFK